LGLFYDVYNKLGYGFLEHVYSLALERELVERGHTVDREVIITVSYKGNHSQHTGWIWWLTTRSWSKTR